VFAVTAVADEKKGERILVVHTLADDALGKTMERFARCDLPALWKPKANQFVRVNAIPSLGTGKVDLRGVKNLAATLAAPA
jgi:acyl-[acyl-carrier-protein]-phospholipid O-acyltransferase/long-chain-fatty-acid--[acyl-carrier-protein] ligase